MGEYSVLMIGWKLFGTGVTEYHHYEKEHTPQSDRSKCTVFDTPEPKLMHLTDYKLATLAICAPERPGLYKESRPK